MQNLRLNQILSSIKAAAANESWTSTYDPLTPSPQGRHLFRSFVNLSGIQGCSSAVTSIDV